jgi:ASC-1-like (ASCH) protein
MEPKHWIKLDIAYCDAVLSGDKNFEVRVNDRGYQKGDLLKFKPLTDLGLTTHHEIDERMYQITYVLNGYGLKEGYVVFGIKETE